MGLIYGQAHTVYVWLSSDTHHTGLAVPNSGPPSTDDGLLCLRRRAGPHDSSNDWIKDVNLLKMLVVMSGSIEAGRSRS